MCYKTVESLSNLVRPKSRVTKIYDPKIKREDLSKKPPKDKGPDMGSYDSKKGYEYTQTKGLSQKFSAAPIVKFYEQDIKRSKKVPSCSHYTVTKDAMSRLSKSPPSIRMRRH